MFTMEENVLNGGFGQNVLEYANDAKLDIRVINVAVDDRFIEHGSVRELMVSAGLDADSVVRRIEEEYTGLN